MPERPKAKAESRPEHSIATRLIHTGEFNPAPDVPLTTPIYETTAFVFGSAEDLRRCQEGKSPAYI